ncbi:MAG TPA: hypothetical protein DEQ61_05390, partial [Streptomyces sp.]|nr:hypothetical protein [Streptomyces sp.]
MFLCCQLHDGRIVLERLTEIIFFRISEPLRKRLGIPAYADNDKGFEAAYAVVRRMFRTAMAAMNPSPLPANKRLSRDEASRLMAAADPASLAEREHRLHQFTEFVLEASLRPVKEFLEEAPQVSMAIDATPVRTYSRGLRTNGPELATDPDAGWYVREGDHRDPDAVADVIKPSRAPRGPTTGNRQKKLPPKRKYLFGYDAHLLVSRDTEHGE